MTKYISDVQTIEEAGTTGIRVTIAESTTGDLEVRAVNTQEFNDIESAIEYLQENGITKDNLEDTLKKIDIDAKTLEGHSSSYFAKTTDLANYELKDTNPLIGQILKDSSGNWDYSTITGLKDNVMYDISGTDEGIVVVIPPNAYDSSTTQASVPLTLMRDRGVVAEDNTVHMMDTYIIQCTQRTISDYGTCLAGALSFNWSPGGAFEKTAILTANWNGKNVTRVLVAQNSEVLMLF